LFLSYLENGILGGKKIINKKSFDLIE